MYSIAYTEKAKDDEFKTDWKTLCRTRSEWKPTGAGGVASAAASGEIQTRNWNADVEAATGGGSRLKWADVYF